jgi:hypothetical protein
MGSFYCKNCDKTWTQFETLDEALEKADHAAAIMKGRSCPNNNLEDLFWNSINVATIKFPERYGLGKTPTLVERKIEFESHITEPDQ